MDTPGANSLDFRPQTLAELEEHIKHFPLMREQFTKRFTEELIRRKVREEQERDARDEDPPYVALLEFGPSKWLD